MICTFPQEWHHFEVVSEERFSDPFFQKMLSLLLGYSDNFPRGYYNFESSGPYKITLHLTHSNENLDPEIKSTLKKILTSLHPIKIYKTAYNFNQEISELITGSCAHAFYTNYSMRTMPFLYHWFSAIGKGEIKKLTVAFDLMVLHILNKNIETIYRKGDKETDYPASFLCYRSHADGFFIRSKQEKAMRDEMESRYQTQKTVLQRRFHTLMKTNYPESPDAPFPAWENFYDEFLKQSRLKILQNKIAFTQEERATMGEVYKISKENIHHSYHNDPLVMGFLTLNKEFQVARLMTSLLYLTLYRLGICFLERYYLCHAISRTVEDLYGIKPDLAMKKIRKALQKDALRKIMSFGFIN